MLSEHGGGVCASGAVMNAQPSKWLLISGVCGRRIIAVLDNAPCLMNEASLFHATLLFLSTFIAHVSKSAIGY